MVDYDLTLKRLRRCGLFKCRECEYESIAGCRMKLNAEAADAIEELLGKIERAENRNVVESEMIDEMYAEIERLKAKVPHWISAKKPPEKPDFYWCNIENTVFPGRYYQEKLWYDSEYFVNVDGIVILHVTHYMPLPVPPMEDQK